MATTAGPNEKKKILRIYHVVFFSFSHYEHISFENKIKNPYVTLCLHVNVGVVVFFAGNVLKIIPISAHQYLRISVVLLIHPIGRG